MSSWRMLAWSYLLDECLCAIALSGTVAQAQAPGTHSCWSFSQEFEGTTWISQGDLWQMCIPDAGARLPSQKQQPVSLGIRGISWGYLPSCQTSAEVCTIRFVYAVPDTAMDRYSKGPRWISANHLFVFMPLCSGMLYFFLSGTEACFSTPTIWAGLWTALTNRMWRKWHWAHSGAFKCPGALAVPFLRPWDFHGGWLTGHVKEDWGTPANSHHWLPTRSVSEVAMECPALCRPSGFAAVSPDECRRIAQATRRKSQLL